MTELKTLKDFKTLIIEKGMDNVPSKVIQAFKRDLKKEAIKDIKELIKTKGFLKIFDCEVEPLIEYIKWKFNITEEELK